MALLHAFNKPWPLLTMIISIFLISSTMASEEANSAPTATPWPLQFHSILLMKDSGGALSLIDLWYDWPGGRNFNIIRDQLGGPAIYDLEWNNGTSFFYTLEPPLRCSSAQLDVGILWPNWLDGATYLGQQRVDGFLCNVWTKADFLWYYEDIESKRPVHWVFYTGREANVMTFEVGAVLDDEKWQAPVYCFDGAQAQRDLMSNTPTSLRGLLGSILHSYTQERKNGRKINSSNSM